MPIIRICLTDETFERLIAATAVLHRPVEDLAECAVAEAALDWDKRRGHLVADAIARQRGENLDGSPRRETVPVEDPIGGLCK